MELKKEWASLKNGSDIRGIASEGIEGLHINLTDEVVYRLACGFIGFVCEKLGKSASDLKIAIGHDSRISAERLKGQCISAFTAMGAEVLDCSLATTPAMFMITVDENFKADASVMLTASHLPFNRNGLKFFAADGGFEGKDITRILELAQENEFSFSNDGKITKVDYLSCYANHISEIIKKGTGLDKPFEGMKIAVDAGNGSGGFYADKVLKPLGADTSGSRYLDPDGNFPNHIPNPEDASAMEAISEAVIESKSDLGLIFDTDVDRAAIVDETGKSINKNRLIALIAAVLMEEKKGTVVTDSVTSAGLKTFIESIGGIHHRFKRGYKNVINEAKRIMDEGGYAPLAIETSGHAALSENYFLDDGAYLVTRLLIKAVNMRKEGKKLTSLISSLKDPKISKGFRMDIKTEAFKEYGQSILDSLKTKVEASADMNLELPNFEGVRVNYKDGWFLLRLSLHEPLMPLDIQCEEEATYTGIIEFIKDFLKDYEELDISKLG